MTTATAGTNEPSGFVASVNLPNFGSMPANIGIADMARAIEDHDFDGVWVSDHIVLVRDAVSHYPFSRTGQFFMSADEDWYEAISVLGHLAGVTSQVELGVGVLVLPLRHPVLVAKQLATVDRLSGGRVVLGAGAGWLLEEFEAMGVPADERGAHLEESIRLLRACWSGAPEPGNYGPWRIPPRVVTRPAPHGEIPVLVGGHSMAALRRAAAHGDGWYGGAGENFRPEDLSRVREEIRSLTADAGRPEGAVSLSVRLGAPASRLESPESFAATVAAYVRQGAKRVTFDIRWTDLPTARHLLARLARSVAVARAMVAADASDSRGRV